MLIEKQIKYIVARVSFFQAENQPKHSMPGCAKPPAGEIKRELSVKLTKIFTLGVLR